MISIAVISENKILKESVEQLTFFMEWECLTNLEEIKEHYANLDSEIIIAGNISSKIDVRKLLVSLRRKNPYTPVIFLSPDLGKSDIDQNFNLRPLNVCKWPFSSLDLVNSLESALVDKEAIAQATRAHKSITQALEEGQAQKAKAALESVRAIIPEYPFSLLAARCCLVAKNYNAAMAAAQTAVSLEPDLPETIEVLAMVQNAMGNRKGALQTMEKYGNITARDAGLLVLKADALLEDGQFSKAKETYALALSLDPHNEAARKGKFLAGVMDGSITALTSEKGATQTSIELAKLCNNKAISFVRAKEFEVAETLYQNTIRILPDKRLEYKLWMNLGLCMKKSQNWAKALEYFRKGKSTAPKGYLRFNDQITAMERMLSSLN